jgi:hypothetical protein
MKKTDLEKHLAKKLDGRLKAGGVPQRFGKGAAVAAKDKPEDKARPAAAKLVAVSCRLPADLLNRLSAHAVDTDGGMSALVAQALEQWLAAAAEQGNKAAA